MYNNKVLLPDISFWQDDNKTLQKVDFNKMKTAGADGVIIRVGQGGWIDPDLSDYLLSASNAGLPIGLYWYWDSRYTPSRQAELLLSKIDKYPQLGIWGDYEEFYGGNYGGFENFKKFMEIVGAKFPDKLLGIYTAPFYWKDTTTQLQKEFAIKWPLWIANYYVNSPEVPYPWSTYILWQYTANGSGYEFGAESNNIDLNIFNGTLDEYKNYFNLEGANGTPIGGSKMKEGTIITPSLKIRTGPGTTYPESYPTLGGLRLGDKVYGELDTITNWIHFNKIIRVTGEVELFDGWASAVGWNTTPIYMTIKDYNTSNDSVITDVIYNGELTIKYSDGRPNDIYVISNSQMTKK